MLLRTLYLSPLIFLATTLATGSEWIETFSQAQSEESLPRALDTLEPAAWADTASELLGAVQAEQSLQGQTRLLASGLLLQSFARQDAALSVPTVQPLRDLAARYRQSRAGSRGYDYRSARIARQLDELADILIDPTAGADADIWAEFYELLSKPEAPADAPANTPAPAKRGFFGRLLEAAFTVEGASRRSSRSVERGAIPPLLERMEADEATALIDRALALPVNWSLTNHPATARLARQRALAGIKQMHLPLWEWVDGESTDALYTALLERFGSPTLDNRHGMSRWSFQRAAAKALVQRGLDGDSAGVMAIAELLDWSNTISINLNKLRARPGQKAALFDALLAVQRAYPAANLWEKLRPLGAEVGRGPDLVEAARELAASAPSKASRLKAQSILAASLLADDQVEAAVALLEDNVASSGTGDAFGEAVMEDAIRLIELGAVLERADWVDLGLEAFCRHFTAYYAVKNSSYALESRLRDAMVALDWQSASAPWDRLQKWLRELPIDASQSGPFAYGNQSNGDLVRRLYIDLLAHRSAHAEVLQQARNFSGWAADDVGGLIDDKTRGSRPVFFVSYPLLLARSLYATGAVEEAGAIAQALLPRHRGEDSVYALFLETHDQADALAYLERIRSIDTFEERPLIWKAQLHLEAGQYASARKTVQQAIAIDPSDGEQKRGTRMRAYSILHAVATAEGASEEAEMLKGIVAAIRLSEDADRLWQAGLLSRALAMYRESLDFFADAYCIQSRLALRFAEEGRFDAARKHYRRAYELMPDSFGRIESHCFGCEGAFRGEAAQSIAEEVFSTMLADRPDHPQLHYLLGYLRENQHEYTQAAEHYRQAATLDPRYYNAWSKLFGLRERVAMSDDERRAISRQLITLDPALVRVPQRNFWDRVDAPAQIWELGHASITWASLFEDRPDTPTFPATAARRAAESSESTRTHHYRTESGPALGPGDYLTRLPAGACVAEIYHLLAEL